MTAVDKSLKDDCKELCRGLSLKQIWLPLGQIRLRFFFCFLKLHQPKKCNEISPSYPPEKQLRIISKRNEQTGNCFILSLRRERPGCKAKKKGPPFCFAVVRCVNSIEVPSSRGGRSEAQHNAPRQGSAMPTRGVPDHSCAEQKE